MTYKRRTHSSELKPGELAKAKNEEIDTLINNWLRQDIALASERSTPQNSN